MTINGAELSYRDQGTGHVLLLLHGWSMSGRFFERQIDRFASEYRVVVPDYRGHGESEKVLSGHTVEQYGADVHALTAALGIERPVVLGWSMGAMVAYEYLKLAGERELTGLVVVDQGASDFKWPDYPDGVFSAEDLAHTNKELQTDHGALAAEFVDLMLHEPDAGTRSWMVEEMLKCPPAIAGSILLDQTVRDDRALIASLRLPTLVVFGEDPKLNDPSAGRWIADQIPGARFEVVAASSHCPFYEQADEFNALVAAFVADLVAGS
ncbi:MAG TPA: alpha/beta hydrolase [Acidimicrobiales bacterium]|nr:alpha/beta hydrolase [Acidimicrobiales bacterium]